MAQLYIDRKSDDDKSYYIDVGSGGHHAFTSWQVAKDKYFQKIIDESLEDPINLFSWTTPLPKLKEDKDDPNAEEFYSNLDTLYARAKIHIGEAIVGQDGTVISKKISSSSDWVEIGPMDQRVEDIVITKKQVIVERTTAEALGWLGGTDE